MLKAKVADSTEQFGLQEEIPVKRRFVQMRRLQSFHIIDLKPVEWIPEKFALSPGAPPVPEFAAAPFEAEAPAALFTTSCSSS